MDRISTEEFLKQMPTGRLVEELLKRTGVAHMKVDGDQLARIQKCTPYDTDSSSIHTIDLPTPCDIIGIVKG